MLKGSVLRFSFLDCMGALLQSPYEVWRDPNAPEDPDRPRKRKLVHFSPSSSQDTCGDGHLAVVCSERQAKVFLMPSQSCLFVHNITESSFVLRADVVSVSNSVCLACFCANGHVMTLRYNLSLFSKHLTKCIFWTCLLLLSVSSDVNITLNIHDTGRYIFNEEKTAHHVTKLPL